MVPWGERHKRWCNLSANTWDMFLWALGLRIKWFLTTRWKLEGAEWANLRAQTAKIWAGGVPKILQASTPVCRLVVKWILRVSTFFLLTSKWSFGTILGHSFSVLSGEEWLWIYSYSSKKGLTLWMFIRSDLLPHWTLIVPFVWTDVSVHGSLS